MMKTLFGNFSKGHFLVLATLHCHDFKTSGPILIIFASFWWEKPMLCTMLKKSQNSRKHPCDSFREVGSHIYRQTMNGLVDIPASRLLKTARRLTRGQQHKTQEPNSQTATHLNSFFPAAIRLWNSLPHSTQSHSLPSSLPWKGGRPADNFLFFLSVIWISSLMLYQ